jgi:hypothetical protein
MQAAKDTNPHGACLSATTTNNRMHQEEFLECASVPSVCFSTPKTILYLWQSTASVHHCQTHTSVKQGRISTQRSVEGDRTCPFHPPRRPPPESALMILLSSKTSNKGCLAHCKPRWLRRYLGHYLIKLSSSPCVSDTMFGLSWIGGILSRRLVMISRIRNDSTRDETC